MPIMFSLCNIQRERTTLQTPKKIGYAAGDFGISVSYFLVGFFFMYYLTDIVGMSPWLAGIVVFIGKTWEGLTNPLVGIINDRTGSRFGPKRFFVLFGAIPFAVCFILLWLIPSSLNEALKFLLAVSAMLLYSTAYTFVSVPYMALVPVITGDYDERTQILGIRAVLSTLGLILGGGAALFISSFSNETLGLRVMVTGFAVVTALSLLIAARSVRGLERPSARLSIPFRANLAKYLALPRERQVLILLIFKFLGAIATGCLMASIPYFAKHVLNDTTSSTYGVAIYTVCSALLIPVWYKMTHIFDKRRLLLIANCLGAVVLLGVALLVQQGSPVPFFIGCGLLGIIMSAYLLIPYSFVPDLVDYYAHKTGDRHESVYFGLWMTVHQIGIAVAGLLLGAFLSFYGYDGTAAIQTQSAVLSIRLGFGLIPGLFLVLAALVLQKYGITRKVYQKVQSELERKNNLEPEAPLPEKNLK
jgi:glycoside/pentoside/hexuronide:cation symporter, GPH family